MLIESAIFQKEKTLFLVNNKLQRLASNIIKSNLRIETPKDVIVCFILAKSFKTYSVALKLTRKGYTEDGEMLIRTLFDAYLIVAAVLEDETDGTANQFYSFDYVTRDRMFNKLKNRPEYRKLFEKRKKNPKPTDEGVGSIEKQAALWKSKFKNTQRWHANKTTGELAELHDVKQYFETAYDLQSQLVHSLPRVINRYILQKGDDFAMNIEPQNLNVDVCLVSAFNMMYFVLDKVIKHYDLPQKQALEKLVLEYETAAKNHSAG